MVENNTILPYEGENHVAFSFDSPEYNISMSQYLFGLYVLEGHNKIEKGHAFPRSNPTKADVSKLAILLKENGFALN
jgi:hypothetical protein